MGKPTVRNLKILVDNSDTYLTEPVTVAEVKTYLQLEGTAYDAILTPLITAVRRQIEAYCNLSLVPKSIRVQIYNTSTYPVTLPFGPVDGISSVLWKKCPAQWVAQVAVYDYNADDDFNLDMSESGLFQIEYATAANDNDALKQAIIMQVGYLFTQRDEPNVAGWSKQVEAILSTQTNAGY